MPFTIIDDEEEQTPKFTILDDEPAAKPKDSPVPVPSMRRGIAQQMGIGATANWADELIGAMEDEEAKKRFIAETGAFRQANPGASIAANIAGGIGSGVGLALGARALPFSVPVLGPMLAQRFVGPVTAGMFGGALSGAGEGTTFDERVKEASKQALTGGVLGGAIGEIGGAIGRGASAVGRMLGIGAEKHGVNLLADAMRKEGLNPTDLQAQIAGLTQRTGKPVMMIDLIDPVKHPETYSLIKKGVMIGEAPKGGVTPRVALTERGKPEAVTSRLYGDIKSGISRKGDLSYKDLEASRLARSAEWKQAFDPIKDTVIDSPEVKEVLSRPFAQDAIRLAIRNAKDSGDAEAQTLFQKTFVQNADGELEWAAAPTLELVQKIKNLGYSPALKSIYQGKPATTDTGTILKQQRDLLAAVDDAVPQYKGIRQNFAQSMDVDNAREAGANLQKTLNQGVEGPGGKIKGLKSDEIIEDYKQMSKPEKDAFLQGLASTMQANLTQKAGTSGARASSIIGDPTDSMSSRIAQLKDVLGNTKRFKTFLEKLRTEKTIEDTSRTFERMTGTGFDEHAVQSARDLLRTAGAAALGRPATAIPAAASMFGRAVAGVQRPTMTPIGQIATSPTSPLNRLLADRFGAPDQTLLRDLIVGAGAGGLTAPAGGLEQLRGAQ